MLAIAPTGKDWFAQLRARSSSQIINFWTPTPWNVKGLSRGDLLYFLLKAPIRKIEGTAILLRMKICLLQRRGKDLGLITAPEA